MTALQQQQQQQARGSDADPMGARRRAGALERARQEISRWFRGCSLAPGSGHRQGCKGNHYTWEAGRANQMQLLAVRRAGLDDEGH